MSDGVINRPATEFDGVAHTYHLAADGSRLWGISSVAKMGEAEDAFGIGSAWGFRVGYEGCFELLHSERDGEAWLSPEHLRSKLQAAGLTPWGTRDRAADRGNWAHDLLEGLATDGSVPVVDGKWGGVDDEYRGHGRAVLQWFLDYRPEFVATEVQVTSEAHGFAGRYDIRCKIQASRLLEAAEYWLPEDHSIRRFIEWAAELGHWLLCLVDLKTSKRIYPLSHFVQLEGYELAGVEMGFPPTDARLVLNTHPDGTYEIGVGYADPEDFLGYLAAYKQVKRIKSMDPEERREKAVREAILAALPGLSRDLAPKIGMGQDARSIGRILGNLRKQGLVGQRQDKVWELA
jgi:GNAT superfamily N-acetyltransferase